MQDSVSLSLVPVGNEPWAVSPLCLGEGRLSWVRAGLGVLGDPWNLRSEGLFTALSRHSLGAAP